MERWSSAPLWTHICVERRSTPLSVGPQRPIMCANRVGPCPKAVGTCHATTHMGHAATNMCHANHGPRRRRGGTRPGHHAPCPAHPSPCRGRPGRGDADLEGPSGRPQAKHSNRRRRRSRARHNAIGAPGRMNLTLTSSQCPSVRMASRHGDLSTYGGASDALQRRKRTAGSCHALPNAFAAEVRRCTIHDGSLFST